MKEELKEEWFNTVQDLDIPAESIYTLLNPVDRSEFITLVNELTKHIYTLKNGHVDHEHIIRSFRLLAIKYLIEFEKDNKEQVYVPMTNPITYPGTYPYPDSPAITNPCPYPYQLPVIYCSTVS